MPARLECRSGGRYTSGMGKSRGTVIVGTSGWSYPHWRGKFYPEDLPRERWLEHYAGIFGAVELNNTFYRLPKRSTLEDWASRTPRDFTFAVKGSRYLTHMKKLKDPTKGLGRFFEAVEGLGRKLGPVLFQLPPRWNADPGRLAEFLAELPRGRRCAFEFRDESWETAEVYRLLEKHGAALCVFDLAGRTSPKRRTADWMYLRLHGPSRGKYQGRYGSRRLSAWMGAIAAWSGRGSDVYVFFDNDQNGFAAADARDLAAMARGERAGEPYRKISVSGRTGSRR